MDLDLDNSILYARFETSNLESQMKLHIPDPRPPSTPIAHIRLQRKERRSADLWTICIEKLWHQVQEDLSRCIEIRRAGKRGYHLASHTSTRLAGRDNYSLLLSTYRSCSLDMKKESSERAAAKTKKWTSVAQNDKLSRAMILARAMMHSHYFAGALHPTICNRFLQSGPRRKR